MSDNETLQNPLLHDRDDDILPLGNPVLIRLNNIRGEVARNHPPPGQPQAILARRELMGRMIRYPISKGPSAAAAA